MGLTIHHGDNLAYLRDAAARGDLFDLVELDGPYGAGLEGWDILTDAEYVAHYAERLTLVRQVLQPWGVVEMFGYPEMVALARAWAADTGTLHLRRWVHWYNNQAAHAGRRVQIVAVFNLHAPAVDRVIAFGRASQAARQRLGISRGRLGLDVEGSTTGRVGECLHERPTGIYPPTVDIFRPLCAALHLDMDDWWDVVDWVYPGLTDLDYLTVPIERAAQLNDEGLRSKPLALYDRIFRPVVPPREPRRALILYGGSGNAAVAAARLGYDVTVCEADAARCDLIRRNYAQRIEHSLEGLPLFNLEAA